MNSFAFWMTSVLLGFALAMDSFSVSVADGLANPMITQKQKMVIPFVFGFFQFIMPVIGWCCVHTVAEYFSLFERAVPWIGFLLLCWIGKEMILSRNKPIEAVQRDFYTPSTLITQGIGTAIDALSVGFAIEEYAFTETDFYSYLQPVKEPGYYTTNRKEVANVIINLRRGASSKISK